MLLLFTGSKWGPNREAFEYVRGFAKIHARLLAEQRMHILVVGNVASEPIHLQGFTATGRVDRMEPYFAAADAALNPILSGGGTNIKMGEFIAVRLPIVSTAFGTRGFRLEDGKTAFLFETGGLAPVLSMARRLFDEDPARLRQMAEDAYAENESAIDMDACAQRLVAAMGEAREQSRDVGHAPIGPCSPSESVQEIRWLR
jgi:glycosyltransferase involved in cell wall biosynthesis